MQKHTIIILFIAAGLLNNSASAIVEFNDGNQHTIDYAIDDGVFVDWQTPNAGTEVELVSGGAISMDLVAYYSSHVFVSGGEVHSLGASDTSEVIVSGGLINSNLYAWDTSQVTFSGGSIGNNLKAEDNSLVTFSGGIIDDDIVVLDNSTVTVSGGTIGDDIFAGFYYAMHGEHTSLISVKGSGFAINNMSVGYGDFASNYASSGTDPYGNLCLTGTLTGTLANGDALNNAFYIFDNADITFAIPEPTTLLLLGLGAAMVRRKK